MKFNDIFNKILNKKVIKYGLYTNCEELILDVFINCIVKKDLKGLIKYGNPTEKKLNEVWEAIWNEYSVLSGNKTHEYLLNLSKEIGKQKSKLLTITLCIQVLLHIDSKICYDELKKLGYDPDNLSIVISKCKTLEITIQQKEKEYQQYFAKQKKSEALSVQDFDNSLINISQFLGFRVDKKVITVSEYVAMVSNYEKHIEFLKKQQQKNGKGKN